MSEPSDQAERDLFSQELGKNFSVIAAAGSGKTRAVTDRIAQIARSPHALEWLPTLIVVTFTHRAADEMQRRARQKMLESRVSLEVVAAFNRAFFGTIHSFCVRLLADYGHYLGLPPHLSLITDDAELWHNFVQSQTSVGRSLTNENRAPLFRHIPVRQLMELGRSGNVSLPAPVDLGRCPELDLDSILTFAPAARSAANIERGQAELRHWEKQYRSGADFLPLPDCPSTAKDFVAIWDQTFAPFRKWLNAAALSVAAEVQTAYREFRLDRGVLTYDDQIRLADALVSHPRAAARIRERNFRVILDEAQDTDPQQFSILLEITRPPAAEGRWLSTGTGAPRPGHFCMVGDFQQSIFGDRADLSQYRRIHDALVRTGAGEAVELAVTFRLDLQHVDFVNAAFPCLFNDADGQVAFVELNARPAVLGGQIIALNIGAENTSRGGEKKSERSKADSEAQQIAKWLEKTTLPELRARSWSEVAILCPRKAWFAPLRQALRQVGFDVQTQSESELNADNPAHAWLTALATIMAKPHLSYETVGVLREVFGVSDHDLATFSEGRAGRFDFQAEISGEGLVADALRSLAALRHRLRNAALYDAVCTIVRGVRLRERLVSLPAQEFGDLGNELDRLLVMAAAAEADGKTLADFANDLRANFDAPRDSDPPRRAAIQLITAQKAKGSEWDAVILPFLCREVRTRSADYARIIKIPRSGELVVALGRDDMSREVKEALKQADRQEMERLLYVAFTRCRHSLVLALDDQVFQTAQGVAPKNSQWHWLRSADTNAALFKKMGTTATHCVETKQAQEWDIEQRAREQKLAALPVVQAHTVRDGSAHAARFVRKLTPSRIAAPGQELSATGADVWKETDPELRPLTVEGAAKRYGIWWHDFAQRIPWTENEPARDAIFEQLHSQSPDPARSLREWKLLREQWSSAAGFPQKLLREAALWRGELPFLWPVDQNTSVEGIIDLAVFSKDPKVAFIIDWKTNRIAPEDAGDLRARYLSQIAAYWQAITRLTDKSVAAAIYSTSVGQFLLYEELELEREWARLRQLPDVEFTGAIAPA